MNKIFTNKQFGGFFALSTLDFALQEAQWSQRDHYGILVNIDSNITLLKDEIPLKVEPGSLICLSPRIQLNLEELSQGEHYFVQFNKEFYCLDLHDKETSCNGLLFNSPFSPPIIELQDLQANKFKNLLKVIEEELEEEDPIQEQMLTAVLKRFLILCARNYRESLQARNQVDNDQIELVRQFNVLVEKHFREHHKVADYASLLHRSPKTLANLFLKFSDQRPLGIIHNRLYIESKRLLTYTDKSSKEIAFDLGFEQPSHFGRFFKKMANQSPSEFKRSLLSETLGKN